MYFGDIENNSVLFWNTSTPLTYTSQITLIHDNNYLQWQDTFAFANGNLRNNY